MDSNVRIALVGPSFFSYCEAIRDEIQARGIPCTFYDERHSNTVLAKIAYRLQMRWFHKRAAARHLAAIRDGILGSAVTDVILINVEVVTPAFVETLRAAGVRVHLYMWDSTNNKQSFLALLPLVVGRGSFEPDDCTRYDMAYIPLFAEGMFAARGRNLPSRRPQVVFLGTLHSRRAELLRKVEELLAGTGVSVRGLLYYHSKWLFAVKAILAPWMFQYLGRLSSKPYGKQQIAAAYFESRAILDIHHPGQTGLTSRTFEALRAGAWLVTLNPTVDTLPATLRERVVLIERIEDLVARLPEMMEKDLPGLSAEDDHFLSLERFTTELLAMAGLGPR